MELTGIHHLTAVSARLRENHRFYTAVLGLRLVRRTVDPDHPGAWHLVYADAVGSPGTALSFVHRPGPAERRGVRSIVRTALRVRDDATLAWWAAHLARSGVPAGPIAEHDGRATLPFEDPEGQRLALVVDGGAGDPPVPWARSPVPAERQLRGLGPAMLAVPRLDPTALVLTRVLGMREVRDYPVPDAPRHTVHVFAMGAGGPCAEVHVAEQPDLPTTAPGAGGVHHLAFRTADASYDAWIERLVGMRVPHHGPTDHGWFRSLHLREPNGVLLAIATDGPGFAEDEPVEALGERLALPPAMEPRRAAIAAALPPFD